QEQLADSRPAVDRQSLPGALPIFVMRGKDRRLPMQPHAQHRDQLLGIDGFCDVIRGTGLDTLLAVSLHGLRSEGDDRQRLEVERSEEHTSELQSRENLVCRRLLEE